MNTDFANIAELIATHWADEPASPIFSDGDAEITREHFLGLAARRCAALSQLVTPGDRVLIQAGRRADFFVDMFSVWAVGAVAVPLAADASTEYVEFLTTVSAPKVALGNLSNLGLPGIDVTPYSQSVPADIMYHSVDNQDTCSILFTSGSTGQPKGVALSHFALANNSLGILETLKLDGDRLFINIPFNFTSAICHFLACAFSNSTLVGIEDKYFLADLPPAIFDNNATIFGGAPVQLRWIADHILSRRAEVPDWSCALRAVMSSGDHLARDIIERLRDAASEIDIFTVYGLTELGGRYCVLPPQDLDDHIGSVGKPIAGLHVTVRDADTYNELPSGDVGEIIASGDLVFAGYLQNPAANAEALFPFGFKTGDVGYLDADGFLYLSGRSDEVFKVNGQKVSAVPIVECLMGTKKFADVAVISHETTLYGTIPVAFYVLPENGAFKKGDVLRELRKTLPNNHLPKEFIAIAAIPRTGSGKVQKHELRKKLTDGAA